MEPCHRYRLALPEMPSQSECNQEYERCSQKELNLKTNKMEYSQREKYERHNTGKESPPTEEENIGNDLKDRSGHRLNSPISGAF